jgi:hypothetical protein
MPGGGFFSHAHPEARVVLALLQQGRSCMTLGWGPEWIGFKMMGGPSISCVSRFQLASCRPQQVPDESFDPASNVRAFMSFGS